MNNLSELKKYLALPQAALRVMAVEWLVGNEWVSKVVQNPNFEFAKTITATKATLTDNSQVRFSQARGWAFDRSTQVAVQLSVGHRITYKWANVAIIEGAPSER